MDRLLKYAGIVALIYFLSRPVGSYLGSKLVVGTPRGRIRNLSLQGLRAQISLPITNNTIAPLPIDAFKGQLFYGQFPISEVYINQRVVLEAQQQTELTASIDARFQNLGQQLINIIQSGDFINALRLSGHLVSQGIIIPINRNISIET